MRFERSSGPPPFSSMNSTPAELKGGSKRRFAHCRKLGLFRKERRWFLPLRLWRLPKAYTGSTTVFVDELDARGFQGSSKRGLIGDGDWNSPLHNLDPANSSHSDFRGFGQIEGTPPEQCTRGSQLGTRNTHMASCIF
jgi:hypothetical protein